MVEATPEMKALVHRVARSYLEVEEPDWLEELDAVFDVTYAAVMEGAREVPEDSESQSGEIGLAIDASFLDGTIITTVLWITITLVHKALRGPGSRDISERLARLERWVAQMEVEPELTRDLLEWVRKVLEGSSRKDSEEISRALTQTADDTTQPALGRTGTVDYELNVHWQEVGTVWKLVYELSAADVRLGLNGTPFGPVSVGRDPQRYVDDLFNDIQDLSAATKEERQETLNRLEAIGGQLGHRLLPSDLQEQLWKLGERGGCLLIQSEEPWVPWELVKLRRTEGGRRKIGSFLCEAFAVTRWLPGVGFESTLPLTQIGVIAPRDARLAAAQGERRDLRSLERLPHRRVVEIEARHSRVIEALASGDFDGLHFAGHGDASSDNADRAKLRLEGTGRLRPSDLHGQASNLGRRRPLVFLNTCRSGRGGLALAGFGGWGKGFLEVGAGAFVGALWEVPDRTARDFAQTFYRHFLSGMPIGEAMRRTRLEIRERYPGHSSWLAYTVFAHPAATCQPEASPLQRPGPSLPLAPKSHQER